jgi:hypothetical protein
MHLAFFFHLLSPFFTICVRYFLVVTVVSVGNQGRSHPMSFSVLIVHTVANLNCFLACRIVIFFFLA